MTIRVAHWDVWEHRHAPENIIEHTHATILVSAFEHQVSWGDTNGEVVDHECYLTYASK